MEAYLVDDAAMRSAVKAAPDGPIQPDQLRKWGAAHGEALEVISWAEGSFMLVADALTGLPDTVAALYGCQAIHGRAINGTSIASGYMPAQAAKELLQGLPEPDFDSPAPEVIAAREELEGWLRRAASRGKGLLLVWD